MLSRIKFWCLACTMLALLWGCGSSSTTTMGDAGKGDAKSDAADGGGGDTTPTTDTTPPPVDSSMDTTVTPGDTNPGDTNPGDTTPGDTTPSDTTPGDTTPADTTPGDTLTTTFTVGGSISGTNNETVTLLDNGSDMVTVSTDGSFTFPTALASGAAFNVTIGTEPADLTCVVAGGSARLPTATSPQSSSHAR